MSNTYIPINIKRDLWFAAHGRCEFAGCNKLLSLHGVTMDNCNISNYAHIIGDSPKGPRGNKKYSKALSKDINNLILLCPECHTLVDSDCEKYSVEILRNMKREHEERILRVTGIRPTMKSLVVAYGPKIGTDTLLFDKNELHNTIFPERYPADPTPIEIQMQNSVVEDGEPLFWENEQRQIESICTTKILERIKKGEITHISLFALGPQPLLVKLGTVLNDKYPVTVFQKHRTPDVWRWLDEDVHNDIYLMTPDDLTKEPVLVIALSANAIMKRIEKRYGHQASIWTITCNSPSNDMLRNQSQLIQFNKIARSAMDAIKTAHPEAEKLKIYMAAPAACAVELGRIRMPKADLPWVIYDYWEDKQEDIETIIIK